MSTVTLSMVPRLKESIKWLLNRHKGKLRADLPSRQDLQKIRIGDEARLDVYWKDLDIGSGPALSVVVHGEEVLRIDCFGPGDGHMHTAFFMPRRGENRLYFPEDSRRSQIDRAVFEVTRNLRYYLDRMVDPAVRAFDPDPERLTSATEEARRIMTNFLEQREIRSEEAGVSDTSV